MSEWLRSWTRNPMGFARTGSNPVRSVHYFCILPMWCGTADASIRRRPPKWRERASGSIGCTQETTLRSPSVARTTLKKMKDLEVRGIDPRASHMQSERSTI